MIRFLFFLLFWALFLPVNISLASDIITAPQKLEVIPLHIERARGGTVDLKVELADEPRELAIGMMFREDVPVGTGMLFLFSDIKERAFWMKNTLVPLDILFLDEEYVVLHIHPWAKPESLERIHSNGLARAALEIAGGEAQRLNIQVGDRVTFALPSQ